MTYTIDRKTAAKQLKVTTRTVDRYIVAKKLSSEKRDGRIWLNKKELQKLRAKPKVDMSTSEMSIDNGVSGQVDSVDVVSTSELRESPRKRQQSEEQVFQRLYEELKDELKIKQQRLEGANYRVGQLEAMVKESVPLPEHQKLLSNEKVARLELEEETESLRDKIQKIKQSLKDEKLSKKLYLACLFIIMLLQPIWFILATK